MELLTNILVWVQNTIVSLILGLVVITTICLVANKIPKIRRHLDIIAILSTIGFFVWFWSK